MSRLDMCGAAGSTRRSSHDLLSLFLQLGFCISCIPIAPSFAAPHLRASSSISSSSLDFETPVADQNLFQDSHELDIVEGDLINSDILRSIRLGGGAKSELEQSGSSRKRRGALRKSLSITWPNGVIPYQFEANLTRRSDFKHIKATIRAAMRHWEQRTCLRFIAKRPDDKSYAVFIYAEGPNAGCASSYGRSVGPQRVYIADRCSRSVGTIIHELGHIAGFLHEQARGDRNESIEILWDNILESRKSDFMEYPQFIDSLNVPYDLGSIMHYPLTAFSKRKGLKTIRPLVETNITIGQRNGLSDLDILQAKRLYNCPAEPRRCFSKNAVLSSGRSVSVQLKGRSWMKCENNTCIRKRCRFLTRNRCDKVMEGCGGDTFKLKAHKRPSGSAIHSGDEVVLQQDQKWLQCSSDNQRRSECTLGTCMSNSASGKLSDCPESVYRVELKHRSTSSVTQINDNQLAIRDDDQVALCRGKGNSQRCLSCHQRLPSCQLIHCRHISRCSKISFSLKQWLNYDIPRLTNSLNLQ